MFNVQRSPAYFMWASAVLGSPGSDTELSSPKISLVDKICFTFWLDMTVWSNRLSSSYNDTLNQEATGIEELVIYLESEVWEEGLPSYQTRKIWEFHEVPRFPKAFQLYSWPLIQKHKELACMLINNKKWETLSIIRPNMNRGRRAGWS